MNLTKLLTSLVAGFAFAAGLAHAQDTTANAPTAMNTNSDHYTFP
jgi:hypothetical protein